MCNAIRLGISQLQFSQASIQLSREVVTLERQRHDLCAVWGDRALEAKVIRTRRSCASGTAVYTCGTAIDSACVAACLQGDRLNVSCVHLARVVDRQSVDHLVFVPVIKAETGPPFRGVAFDHQSELAGGLIDAVEWPRSRDRHTIFIFASHPRDAVVESEH